MKRSNSLSRLLGITIVMLGLFGGCSKKATEPAEKEQKLTKTNEFLVDSLATPETVALFKNLQTIAAQGVLFGHQDDLAYGVGWWAEAGRSDIKSVCGDYPAVYGWDLGDINQAANLDGVNFVQMKGWIREVFTRGGINTISMHLDNPVTGGNAWDNSPAVASILPGQRYHNQYLKTLDLIANFLKDLKTADGLYIPIILRPYHEHNHDWPWWGSNSCTVEEYNALWKMTVEYFRDHHQLHHLLYAISPQETASEADYLARYPGDAYVDILGQDYYLLWNRASVSHLGRTLAVITTMAENRNKVAALTEIGIDKVAIDNWWTDYLLTAIQSSNQTRKLVWALVWRNASKEHHFGPYPGHASAPDFVNFYRDPFTIFESDLPEMYQ